MNTATDTTHEDTQVFEALKLAGLEPEDYRSVYEDFKSTKNGDTIGSVSLEEMAELESSEYDESEDDGIALVF